MENCKAILKIDKEEEEYLLSSCRFSFSQSIGQGMKPGSEVMAGLIECAWEEDGEEADETLLKWASDPKDYRDGSIKFMDDKEKGKTFREIKFQGATIVEYSGGFDGRLSCNFTISTKIFNIGAVEYENMAWDTKRSAK